VLVIDNADRLANTHPDILQTLQWGAEDAICNRAFILVFVSSDGPAAQQLESQCVIIVG
jgi:hypothetical protein